MAKAATMEAPRLRSITEQAVFVAVRFERFGNSRRVASSQVEVDADKTRISVTKRLLDSQELQEVTRLDHKVIGYLDSKCLPYERGLHVLPLGLLKRVDEDLRAFEAERNGYIDAFVAEYPKLLEAAREPLGGLFNERDYLTADQARAEFRMGWNYITLSTPGALADISKDLFNEERSKIASKMEESYEEWRVLLRVAMADLVKRLEESLVEGPDGKSRKLTDSAVNKLKDFLETFEFRNINNDQELAGINAKLKDLMDGVTVKDLRESDRLKENIGIVLQDASRTLETMTKGVRKIRD